MNNRQKAAKPEVPMSAMDAIYHRRAVRNYTPRTIARAVLRKLLDAAVHLLPPCTRSHGHSPSFRIRPC